MVVRQFKLRFVLSLIVMRTDVHAPRLKYFRYNPCPRGASLVHKQFGEKSELSRTENGWRFLLKRFSLLSLRFPLREAA